MKIGIYVNTDKDEKLNYTAAVVAACREHNIEALIDRKFFPERGDIGIPGLIEGDFKDCDFLVSLGGDGTFLSTVHLDLPHNLPRFGVNLGSVGFLPEVEPEEVDEAVGRLISGDYVIESRMLLDMKAYNDAGDLIAEAPALNDVTVHRAASRHILTISMSIDGDKVDKIPGDGIIIAAPTGSTAYSLACGGPILHPEIDAIVITPISPHTLHNRSFVCKGDSNIELKINEYPAMADLSADGRINCTMESNYKVTVARAEERVSIVRFGSDKFFVNLPEKIQLRGVSK